ncbi:MAG: hypothetical protein JSW33_05895 [bacterium]|nr:MAG: hypothetical protein JSW33_05895 [bacterium]
MQRVFLLVLSIGLGVLVLIFSLDNIDLPLLTKNSGKIEVQSFEPFYYVALKIPSFIDDPEQYIDRLQEELKNQNLGLSEAIFIIQEVKNSGQKDWIIATRVPEISRVKKPLYVAKWNWKNVLVWKEDSRKNHGDVSKKIVKYLEEHKLFAVGPVVEFFEKSPDHMIYWLPVGREVGN